LKLNKNVPFEQVVQANGKEALFGWKTHDLQLEGQATHTPHSLA